MSSHNLSFFAIKSNEQKAKNSRGLNLLTNSLVKIANKNVIFKQVKNSLGIAYQTSISTKEGAVYEISSL